MKHPIIFALGILAASFGIHTAHAKVPVWKITNGDQHMYLGGTIHLLSKDDYPLPKAFETAYDGAEDIWLETDAEAMKSLDTQAKFLPVMMYQDGRSLSQVLTRETYQRLTEFLAERGLPVAAFDTMTPAGLSLTLTTLELQRLGLVDGTAGVDAHFDHRANKDGKDRLDLETIDEQIGFIASLNELEPNTLVLSSLEEVEQTKAMWPNLLGAWRQGDLDKLNEIGVARMKQAFPAMYEVFLAARNKRWMSEIKQMLASPEVEFMLVGVLHMAGDDGLIELMQRAGYTVEQLD
ncbi:hypothetical protein GCM10008090_17460 [Arenicella chitinivorans]|uniref:TraB/GumN family protein n=1 Tax=Arenicella chitinivorans TaxID=1329800 RepID=A0A918RPS0_9GAMM|nr:TraB/GumN family protein [Arenicella chitinivorans]GHA08132.1 hypothetical protein GCM10008090_17460 [Arenicella chitinivorans]